MKLAIITELVQDILSIHKLWKSTGAESLFNDMWDMKAEIDMLVEGGEIISAREAEILAECGKS